MLTRATAEKELFFSKKYILKLPTNIQFLKEGKSELAFAKALFSPLIPLYKEAWGQLKQDIEKVLGEKLEDIPWTSILANFQFALYESFKNSLDSVLRHKRKNFRNEITNQDTHDAIIVMKIYKENNRLLVKLKDNGEGFSQFNEKGKPYTFEEAFPNKNQTSCFFSYGSNYLEDMTTFGGKKTGLFQSKKHLLYFENRKNQGAITTLTRESTENITKEYLEDSCQQEFTLDENHQYGDPKYYITTLDITTLDCDTSDKKDSELKLRF